MSFVYKLGVSAIAFAVTAGMAYHYSCILLSALNQCATMTKLGIMDGGVVGRRDAGALGFLTP